MWSLIGSKLWFGVPAQGVLAGQTVSAGWGRCEFLKSGFIVAPGSTRPDLRGWNPRPPQAPKNKYPQGTVLTALQRQDRAAARHCAEFSSCSRARNHGHKGPWSTMQ